MQNRFPIDPAVALPKPAVMPPVPGPAHQAQYVVELVGPRTAPASAVARLLDGDWYGALGEPSLWAMRPADTTWQTLTASRDGSYDSIALAWDVFSPKGTLTSQAGGTLQRNAERFAEAIGRRAIPLPLPDEIDSRARVLTQAKENLDAGVSLAVIARSGVVTEEALWTQCARLGLTFSPEGSFDWRADEHPAPLFSVTPIGETDSFSLAGVQRGERHQGVTVGYRIATCPDPRVALDGAFRAADVIAAAIGGVAFDEDQRPLNERVRANLRKAVTEVTSALDSAGLRPGSSAALRVFWD